MDLNEGEVHEFLEDDEDGVTADAAAVWGLLAPWFLLCDKEVWSGVGKSHT